MARIKITDYKRDHDLEPLEVEMDDGSVFTIMHPLTWPDEAEQFIAANDNAGLTKLIMGGEERYTAFKAAGGTSALVGGILKDWQGGTLGESPASAAS